MSGFILSASSRQTCDYVRLYLYFSFSSNAVEARWFIWKQIHKNSTTLILITIIVSAPGEMKEVAGNHLGKGLRAVMSCLFVVDVHFSFNLWIQTL